MVSSSECVPFAKARRGRWAERKGEEDISGTEGKRHVGRSRHRWVDSNKMYLGEIG
jgi:hypothetical protein